MSDESQIGSSAHDISDRELHDATGHRLRLFRQVRSRSIIAMTKIGATDRPIYVLLIDLHPGVEGYRMIVFNGPGALQAKQVHQLERKFAALAGT